MKKSKEKLIASAIFIEDDDNVFYWLGSTNIGLNKLLSSQTKIYPTSIMWAFIIDYYIKNKKNYINLGSSENLPNVQKFKETLGGEKKLTIFGVENLKYILYFGRI